VTAISVIEHGFQREKLLAEISRILKPKGFFIASVDYWPEKIDTDDVQAFGMDWTIFSKEDLSAFIREAAKYGLQPCGALEFDALDRVVKWKRKQYTFAWLVMQKI
jgi:SAM-dependent methyltransferase